MKAGLPENVRARVDAAGVALTLERSSGGGGTEAISSSSVVSSLMSEFKESSASKAATEVLRLR